MEYPGFVGKAQKEIRQGGGIRKWFSNNTNLLRVNTDPHVIAALLMLQRQYADLKARVEKLER